MTPPIHDDPDAPASPEELAAAEALRTALEDPSRAHEDAELLRAASLAHTPRELPESENRALVEAAVAKMPTNALRAPRGGEKRRGGVVVRVTFGAVASAVALAAGVALFFQTSDESAPHAKVELVRVRSTQPLFDEPFARQGGTTARIDRIAMAREDDLRANSYSRWGVR